MSTFAVRPVVKEHTGAVHLSTERRTPACHVLCLDNWNGLVRRLRLTKRREMVTCKACLRIPPRLSMT